jgi:hypothetical protein
MAAPRTASAKADATPAIDAEPEVAPGLTNLGSALAALNPVHIARQILPSRRTPVEHLAFYATIAGLAFAEVIEPPIAVLIVVGHRLHSSRSETFREIGEGLDKVG